jgi:hypothetical protein
LLSIRSIKVAERYRLVRFHTDYNCGPELTKVGGQYFVYQEPFSRGVANLTREYFPTMDEVKYAEGIASEKLPYIPSADNFCND